MISPNYYHREYANDIAQKVDESFFTNQCRRVALVALPFISLYKPLGFSLSLGLGSARTLLDLSNLYAAISSGSIKESAYQFLQTGVSISSVAGTLFAHPLGMFISTAQDILIEATAFTSYINQGNHEEAIKSSVNLLNNALYLGLFIGGGLELSVASLACQVALGLYNSKKEFTKGKQLEGAGHLLMAGIRGRQLLAEAQLLKTEWSRERAEKVFLICKEKLALICFQAASYLTDPACFFHKTYRLMAVDSILNPTDSKITSYARQALLGCKAIGWGATALITSIPGIALRRLGAWLQDKPFTHIQMAGEFKELPSDSSFTLLSWNVCCIGGGYPITNGGVLPWSDRINGIRDRIREENADVVCLYEIFDIQSALTLYDQLKNDEYRDFYFNIGPRAIGVSSGIFVASKYPIKDPEFVPFPVDTLVGRTKNASKGFFNFHLPFVHILATHLQHSEASAFPTEEEKSGRSKQMELIIKCSADIITGDLNLDDKEYETSTWKKNFTKGTLEFGPSEYTWGGDQFSAELVGDTAVSGPLNLDHTLAKTTGKVASLTTRLVETGFDPTRLNTEALSDHGGLFTRCSTRLP